MPSYESRVPRYPAQFSLPPLAQVLPNFVSLDEKQPKLKQVTDWLRPVIQTHRTTRNLTFYSTRDLARFFGVSQNTATTVVRVLEGEGLLRRVRGSETLLLGTKVITRSKIRAVAGLLMWAFAQRFSEIHADLGRHLAEDLWPNHIALEIIPHFDLGDTRPDLDERLKKHALDFAIWLFPFPHHREHLLRLQDRGIRNLVIGEAGTPSSFEPHVLVDFASSYRKLFTYWREAHGINRVILVQAREFTPRARGEVFQKIAMEMGVDCCVEASSYTLPAELLVREKQPVGIALLDEHSMVEFSFYDPPTFVSLLRKHRILLGNGTLNIPFVPNGELRLERIFVPINGSHPSFKSPMAPAITRTLVQWCAGNFSAPPEKVSSIFWDNGRLWRYL